LTRRALLGGGLATLTTAWLGRTADAEVVAGATVREPILAVWYPRRQTVGRPTSAAIRVLGGGRPELRQQFEHATIYWGPTTGGGVVLGAVRRTYDRGGGAAALGIPVGVERHSVEYHSYTQACAAGRVFWSRADGGKAVPSAATPRLAGARNFRDAAGHDGDVPGMRRGVLFRSNRLAALSGMDAHILGTLGVRHVVDLRTAAVAAAAPDRRIGGIGYQRIGIASASGPDYGLLVTDERRRAAIGAALNRIAELPGPVLVHCTYGRDRTGWLVALVQALCGVPMARIVSEYLKSNAYLGGSTVRRSYLAAAFDEAHRRYGDLDGYLAACAVTPAAVAALRARMAVTP
jgi:protein-tyrosine phosphatase